MALERGVVPVPPAAAPFGVDPEGIFRKPDADRAVEVRPENSRSRIAFQHLRMRMAEELLVDPEEIRPESLYAFVMTMSAGKMPRFFLMLGKDLLSKEQSLWGKYGRSYMPKHGRGLRPKVLGQWENNWAVIDA